jgi:hypothetical protein
MRYANRLGGTMRVLKQFLAMLGAAALLVPPALAQDIEVDLELVLAVDVSRSMDPAEQELQKAGYLAGLQHPEVLQAIQAGFLGRIAVTYVEWAGPHSQATIMPWGIIDGPESAATFADVVSAQPISSFRGTSISGALDFTAPLFDGNGFASTRQVIDVSGDGPNNMGNPVLHARQRTLERGITINGLPIMIRDTYYGGYSIPDLDIYYEDCVIGGPGAFIVTVESVDRIAEAIRRKLVLEIAGPPPRIMPAQLLNSEPRIDCLIGEKLRRSWIGP